MEPPILQVPIFLQRFLQVFGTKNQTERTCRCLWPEQTKATVHQPTARAAHLCHRMVDFCSSGISGVVITSQLRQNALRNSNDMSPYQKSETSL